MKLFLIVAAIWLVALLIPTPQRTPKPRKRAAPEIRYKPERAKVERIKPSPDPDEIEFLQNQKRQLYTIAAEIDELPDGERKTRKQIAIDKQIFAVDKKLKRIYD